MSVLNNLEPKEVFHYFEQLSQVPRQTFHNTKISNFCVEFAKEHGLEYVQDSAENVIIKKPGTPGYEDSEPVILQGHMDMVAVKTQDSDHDFENDPLELFVEDGKIGAKNTSLGADNGIAIAYSMALLASKDIPHPPLEVIITTDEEVGMGGAKALDFSDIKGKLLLNIDSEEEGVFTVGCAGGIICDVVFPIEWSEESGTAVSISIKGLKGGHSGNEIQNQNGNAHKMMGRMLYELATKYDFNLVSTNGGTGANVIAQTNEARLIAASSQADELIAAAKELADIMIDEFAGQEPHLSIEAVKDGEETVQAMDATTTANIIAFLFCAPDGVYGYERAFPDLVETSLNTGIVATTENTVKVSFQIRSSVPSKLESLRSQLLQWTELTGSSLDVFSEYPAWKYNPDSRLRPLMSRVYKEMFGHVPTIETTHAGLECGIMYDKKTDLDIVSFGPDLSDVHSFKERMDIKSVERTWEYIKAVLKACK